MSDGWHVVASRTCPVTVGMHHRIGSPHGTDWLSASLSQTSIDHGWKYERTRHIARLPHRMNLAKRESVVGEAAARAIISHARFAGYAGRCADCHGAGGSC
jgi:hypothetical protein